ncbi:hypothetical protein ACX2VN_004486 [Providencia stuartii]
MFIDGIANWLGVSNPLLNENYHLFNSENYIEDFGLSEKIEDKPDDAINIHGK